MILRERLVSLPVNPARAGMIPLLLVLVVAFICKPRASGDDPPAVTSISISGP